MKKFTFMVAALLCAAAATLTSCSDNDDPNGGGSNNGQTAALLDYSAENADNWHNYSVQVARLLANDATRLNEAWTVSYNGGATFADIFRNHSGNGYTSPLNCIEEMIDGCADIANEVGTAKIGDPYDLYKAGRTEEALYAVESWYSWHSREDYTNNIYSIRNTYYGSLDGTVATASMASKVAAENPALDTDVRARIDAAAKAILAIPQPFRNNIDSSEASAAMTACAELDQVLSNDLKAFFENLDSTHTSALSAIVTNYVDAVVLPTYSSLKERNAALLNAVQYLSANRTDAAFEAACQAWLSAREPWEKSEAFLFGPVDALGLDPNMDSWPLDQDAIVNHLKSGVFTDLDWSDSDSDDTIEAVQNIRGFHTLEFLLFKDGKPRVVR